MDRSRGAYHSLERRSKWTLEEFAARTTGNRKPAVTSRDHVSDSTDGGADKRRMVDWMVVDKRVESTHERRVETVVGPR